MSDILVNSLIQALENECSWVDTLIELLQEEKKVLISRQYDKLESISEQKETLSRQLQTSAQSRITSIPANDGLTNPPTMTQFLASLDATTAEKVKTLNINLANKLSLCHDLNTVNGQVIATNIYTKTEIINTLTGNNPNTAMNLYAASGEISMIKTSRRHEEA